MQESAYSSKRIAKNTVVLYARSIVIMLISLYTSRVILQQLGVEDYGIYSVIGGLVAMLSLISSSLSASVSRFITFELGRGDKEKLRKIFSTSVLIQLGIVLVVLIVAEVIAMWFLRTQMQIPVGRETAAEWVLHCSIIVFCINLISVPYNACIIAHEHMKAFAYISILDAMLKLGVSFCLAVSPVDKLIFYAVLMAAAALIIRLIYGWYGYRNFPETRGNIVFDKAVFKEMLGFSGWSFFTNSTHIFNSQGVNMLINVFFGVTVNAARGIANQVEGAVMSFVNNFTTAINPQITKCYATGEKETMHALVCRGSKFSYFLIFMMALPLICEAPIVLRLWLTTVPDYAVVFVQLSLVMGMIDCLGQPGVTACMATGRLRKYALIITPIGFLEFPLTWLLFAFHAPVVSTYYLYIAVKAAVIVARMFLLRDMTRLPVRMYIKKTIVPVIRTTIVAAMPSIALAVLLPEGILRLLLSVSVGVMSVAASSLFLGMTAAERDSIISKVIAFWNSQFRGKIKR